MRACDRIRVWRKARGLTLGELSDSIGDEGGQLQRWESGLRSTLPLRLKVALSAKTEIPLDLIVDSDELKLARQLLAVMARDAAA